LGGIRDILELTVNDRNIFFRILEETKAEEGKDEEEIDTSQLENINTVPLFNK